MGDRNVISDSPDMCDNDIQNDRNDVECDDERVALANLIANLKLDVDENKKIQKKLKKANTTHAYELTECKSILAETSRTLEESNSIQDSCLVALQNKQTELEKYKTFNDRTVDYEKLEHNLNETLGLLAQKDIDIKEGLKLKAYEISVVKEKHDDLVKQSLLTKAHYEGLVKDKTKIPHDQSDPANRLILDREETLTLETERVNHRTNVSRPQLKSTQMKDKVVPNTSQVKLKKTEVEDHHSISSISNQSKSVTACNDSLKSRTSNVNAVCGTCGKCVFNSNHDACVSKYLNDVNARTKKPKTSKSYYRMLYEKTIKAWKWWIEQQCPSGYKWVSKKKMKWVPKVKNETVKKRVSFAIDNASRITNIVQLILFIVDSGCTKHMTGNISILCYFVEKYMRTVHFGNDQFAPILGYGYLVQGNITINRVYYVEGLKHNLFSVGQCCDADLEVAFRKSTCFVRDLQGNDLLTGNRGSDLYTISLQETTSSTPICLMAKASPTQAWLWHRRLSHLNFDYINLLSKKDVVIGLPKLKYVKDQLCSSCEVSKAKRSSFKTKTVPSLKGRLNLLHMDLCGPMRVASINGKKYILVIVDDYSRYTWTLFLRSKDETPEVLKDFLTMIQRNLQAPVISVRTDRGTEFLNKTLHAFFKEEGIEHQTSTPRTPEQNGVVERRNRTLVEAARTMLSASKLPLFFWAEAIATACYTQNRSIIIPTHEKTAYHIINDRKPSIKHLYIFDCTCYLTRDGENLDKMKEFTSLVAFVT
ncbi:retrovirus-related pol polyprotein from transposon TNT 1-94 [Tanacetum coccineum]